ncbi:MAG: leucyl aminopeptidase [Nitrososphaerales archaeon]
MILSSWVVGLNMEINVESGRIEEKVTELLALGLFEGETELTGIVRYVDDLLSGAIIDIIKAGDFTGKLNQNLLLYSHNKIKSKRLLLVGLGRREEYSLEAMRSASGKVALQVRDKSLPSYMTLLHGEDSNLPVESLTQALVEGSELALYTFTRFKTETEGVPKEVKELTILVQKDGNIAPARDGVARARVVCDAIKLARDLSNAPSNDVTPQALADVAKMMAERLPLKCEVLERHDMEKLGMGGLLAVSSGSQKPPKMIIMEYKGTKDSPPIVLVGKAITFDSGGISIKPSEKMEDMKYDKSGGVAIIATMQTVAELRLPLNIIAIIPATENMPSGSAYKPGDVLRHYGGKTSEVVSTDAEGRLILADALAYATNYKPRAIIDIATLTGACVVALGTHASGIMTNNQDLAKKVIEAGEASGERVWQLPLWKDYSEQIRSEVADMKNTGGRAGGAIVAAAFLSKFVGNYPWVHIDIAGTAYTQEGSIERSYVPKGATGIGVRLLIQLLRNWT